MGPKAGARGYLLLGDSFEEPRWRQALVVAVEEGWLKTLVRCSKEEMDQSQLSHVLVKDTCFCLVEAAMEQMRIGGPSDAMDLGEENRELLAAAKLMLESEDDLNFATASDVVTRKGKKKKAAVETSSDSGEEDGVSSELLQDLRKNWLGSGTTADKKKNDAEQSKTGHHRSKRFSLIEKSRREDRRGEGPSESEAAQVMLKAALGANDPLHGLLALQIAQGIKKDQRSKKHRRKSPSDSSSRTLSPSSTSSSESLGKSKGHSRLLRIIAKRADASSASHSSTCASTSAMWRRSLEPRTNRSVLWISTEKSTLGDSKT